MKKFIILLALPLTLFSAIANADVVERNFDVASGGTLQLETDAGSIEIISHESNTVEARIKRKGSSEENLTIEFDQSGDTVYIKGDRQGSDFWNWGSSGAHFEITVPSNFNLKLRTSGGSISIDDLTGEVKASTSGGSIKVGKVMGTVDVRTSGGSIKVDEVAGQVNADTAGGSIKVSITEQPGGDCRLTTSGGSVTAYLAEDIAVNLFAKTSGGSVDSEFKVNGYFKRTKIEGTINGGGPELYLKTSGGSVRVKKI